MFKKDEPKRPQESRRDSISGQEQDAIGDYHEQRYMQETHAGHHDSEYHVPHDYYHEAYDHYY